MNIYAQLEKNTGKKEINNVYIGKDDYLIEKYSERDFDDELQKMNVKNLCDYLHKNICITGKMPFYEKKK